MSLFDTIYIESGDLKLPSKHAGILPTHILNDKNNDWQTKSLNNCLEKYKVSKNKILCFCKEKSELVDDEGSFSGKRKNILSSKWVKYNYTGKLNFYTSFDYEDHDIWVEFDALVVKGKVGAFHLVKFSRENNIARKIEIDKVLNHDYTIAEKIKYFYHRNKLKLKIKLINFINTL